MTRTRILAAAILIGLAGLAFAQLPPPEPPPLKVDFPKYETRTLANGLIVYAMQHSEQPVVSFRLTISAGAAMDPEKLPGAAAFAAGLLNQGTATRTANQIAETVDRLGASVEASANMESTTVSGAALKEHTNVVLELMADVLLHPKFAEEEVARKRQREISGLQAEMEEPDYIADTMLNRVVFGAHPYAHPTGGTLDSLAAIQRADLVKFHETYYAPNISALAIVGDLPTKEAFSLAERYFGTWKSRAIPSVRQTPPPKPTERRIVIVDMPESVQTEIRVGQLTVPRNDPQYFPVLVTSSILGSSGSGRLHRKLREEKGLTYGAYATIDPHKGPGVFLAVTDTRTEKTGEALGLILEEMDRLQAGEPTPAELKDIKNFIIGSFPLSIEQPTQIASRLMNVFVYDLGADYLKTFRDRIAAVSAADVLRVSKEKLSPGTMTVVLAGKAGAFGKEVARFGTVETIPLDKVDFGSTSLMR
jgi:zinc protease